MSKEEIIKLRKSFQKLNSDLIAQGINIELLKLYCFKKNNETEIALNKHESCPSNGNKRKYPYLTILIFTISSIALITNCIDTPVIDFMVKYALGTRCFIPNNYLIWEATRPVSDCEFCKNVTKALILPNVTREQFAKYVYSAGPIVIKGAVKHWPAMQFFTYDFFKNLYENIEGAYESVDEGCQFLHFQSDFVTIRDVFRMSEARAKNLPGEKPWYIGLGNCHPEVLAEMRKYYSKPHFLPLDAEISSREYIFFGYNDGATMHLDYIPRLMWQAQLSGNKTWKLVATPECEAVCSSIEFYVEAGDAVLLDTRIWYHSTTNSPGIFSLTLQSEYG